MTARDEVVTALQTLVPAGVRVLPYARAIDPPEQTTVMVRVDVVEPSPTAPNAERVYRFALVVVPAKAEPGPADDELDAALEDVLYALESDASQLTWSRAERGTFQDTTYPAYEITLTVPFSKE